MLTIGNTTAETSARPGRPETFHARVLMSRGGCQGCAMPVVVRSICADEPRPLEHMHVRGAESGDLPWMWTGRCGTRTLPRAARILACGDLHVVVLLVDPSLQDAALVWWRPTCPQTFSKLQATTRPCPGTCWRGGLPLAAYLNIVRADHLCRLALGKLGLKPPRPTRAVLDNLCDPLARFRRRVYLEKGNPRRA